MISSFLIAGHLLRDLNANGTIRPGYVLSPSRPPSAAGVAPGSRPRIALLVCPAGIGGVIVYLDGSHPTKEFSKSLAPYLAAVLDPPDPAEPADGSRTALRMGRSVDC